MSAEKFTEEQIVHLENLFEIHKYSLSSRNRTQIAHDFGLNEKNVQVWFHSRRKQLRNDIGRHSNIVCRKCGQKFNLFVNHDDDDDNNDDDHDHDSDQSLFPDLEAKLANLKPDKDKLCVVEKFIGQKDTKSDTQKMDDSTRLESNISSPEDDTTTLNGWVEWIRTYIA